MIIKHTKLHPHLQILFLVLATLTLVGVIWTIRSSQNQYLNQPTKMGVSFSPQYAKALGLDPKNTYQRVLSELNVKQLRLNAYWNEIEPTPDNFEFSELDYYIDEAGKENAEVILTVGYKLPRWPECRAPKWVQKQDLRERQLLMVQKVIEKYNDNPTITAFQIENEPLLNFGICPPIDREFLQQEMIMVRKVSKKPLILTDSGELRSWKTPMQLSDIFGTTLYRQVDSPPIGQINYPLQPWFYATKSEIIRKTFAPNNQKTIIAELQAEAWSDKFLAEVPVENQVKNYPVQNLEKGVEYAKKTGFDEIYLWGIEWWYYLETQNHPEYLQFAESIF